MPDLKTKIFQAGGTTASAIKTTSTFKGFKVKGATPDKDIFKIVIELSFPANKLSTIRDFNDFSPADPKDIANWVYFEQFDTANPASAEIDSANVFLTSDGEDTTTVTATIKVGGGKTQSGS